MPVDVDSRASLGSELLCESFASHFVSNRCVFRSALGFLLVFGGYHCCGSRQLLVFSLDDKLVIKVTSSRMYHYGLFPNGFKSPEGNKLGVVLRHTLHAILRFALSAKVP